MNQLISALLMAVLQGIAEWFPVSSSSHLVLLSHLLGFTNTLEFDVTLHFGTLMAVFVYFGRDITDIIEALLKGQWKSENGKLGLMLIVATIPAAILGFLLRNVLNESINNLGLMALGLSVTGMFLLVAYFGSKGKKAKKINYKIAGLIGLAQAFSIFRGISRTGSTYGSGLLLGLDEKNAIKFSFLLSIPIVFGANLVEIGNKTLPKEYIFAALVSFLVGLLMINVSCKYVLSNRKNLKWFGIYVLLLAAGIGIYLLVVG